MPVRIEKVDIKNFRRFHDLTLEFPKPITLIGGTNGTSKSTLLGMLGQPLGFDDSRKRKSSSYTDNYDSIRLRPFKTIAKKMFATKYSEVFRMSRKYDNPSKDSPYVYVMHLSGDCINDNTKIKDSGLVVRSIARPSNTSEIRFVAGPGYSQESGEGNFPHPVIYLGLDRLSPLALCSSVNLSEENDDLLPEEKLYLSSCYRNILTIIDNDLQPQLVQLKTNPKGDFYGPQSSDYDAESCSAGQDNLGQILSSIISFQRLKADLGDRYQGGLLLIDEIDATLHPVAQEKLIETLLVQATELNLQIIATTHSLYLFQKALSAEFRNNVGLIFLGHEAEHNITKKEFDCYADIENWLNYLSGSRKKAKQITLLREDYATWDFFRCLVGSSVCAYLQQHENSVGASILGHIGSINIPEIKKLLIIVDGDKAGKDEVNSKRTNLLALPGDTYPENLLYDYLKQLPMDDSFFSKYSQRVIFRDYINKPTKQDEAKAFVKNWYQDNKKHFGYNAKKAFQRWIESNKVLAKEFCVQFASALEKAAKANNIEIPRAVFDELKSRHD